MSYRKSSTERRIYEMGLDKGTLAGLAVIFCGKLVEGFRKLANLFSSKSSAEDKSQP